MMEERFAIVTLETQHLGFDDETNESKFRRQRTINLFPDQASMEKWEDELQGHCDDVYNYQTLWKGHVNNVNDRVEVKTT